MPNESFRSGPSCTTPLALLAAKQHGVVTVAQLRELGITGSVVAKRRARGELHRVFPGVYAVGHTALSREGRWLAGVFAGGEGAALGHKPAAGLLGLERWPPRTPEVLVPRPHRPIPGVNLRVTRSLHPLDVTVVNGIPVTTVPRLLIDLSDVCIAEEVTHYIHEAAHWGMLDLRALDQAKARANGRHNLAVLDAALAAWLDGSAGTRSRGEIAFRRAVGALGLPPPLTNMNVRGHEVDFHWPDRMLVLEIDGRGHLRPPSRVTDPARDRELVAAGWTVLRCKTYEIAVKELRTEVDRSRP